MAIKMKHSGNATATTFASMGGGEGKRRAEDAKAFAQIAASRNAAANRQLQGAHASPISATAPHAQLISAPTGGGAHAIPGPGGIGATARLGGGAGASSRAGRTSGSSGSGSSPAEEDYKMTGTDRFSRPDDDSVWNDYTKQWQRKWLPGEKEAEALERTLSVKTPYEKELLDFKNLLAMENNAFSKQLSIASMPTKNQTSDLSPFGSQLQKAYEVVLATLGTKTRDDSIGLQRIYDGIMGGGETSDAPVEQQGAESTPDIASIYANGGSYFGNGGTNDAPVAVRQPAGAVQTDPAMGDDESKRQYNWF